MQTMSRDSGSSTTIVYTDENTDIFQIDRLNETLVEISLDDVQVNSMMSVWGMQDSEGNWITTDIGIMRDVMMPPPP
jgi:hypothetical protein